MTDANSKVPARAKPKGLPRGGSRKGKPNKATAELKDMIRQALEQAGGINYLMRQADENPNAFLGLVGKILPKEATHTIEGGEKPIQVDVTHAPADAYLKMIGK